MISFCCPKCKTQLQRSDAEAGTKALCPSCNQKLLVPTPPRLDKTMLGQLQPAPEPRTMLGQLSSSTPAPTPPSPVRAAAPMPAAAPLPVAELYTPPNQPTGTQQGSFSFDNSSPPPRTRPKPPRNSHPLAILAGIVILALVLLGIMNAGLEAYRSSSRSTRETASRSSTGVYALSTKSFTESDARDKLKKALNAWVAGKSPQELARQCRDIDFAEPFFTDGAALLGFDITKSTLYEAIGQCSIYVSMKYSVATGGEDRYSRYYDVHAPNERGVWQITVSSHTPAAPAISTAGDQQTARNQLIIALNAWVANTTKAEFSRKYPTIDFTDLAFSEGLALTRYDIDKVVGPFRRGWQFYTHVVFFDSARKREVRVLRVYEVYAPDANGVYRIRGCEP